MAGIVWIAGKDGVKCDKAVAADTTTCSKDPLVAAARHNGGLIPGMLSHDEKHTHIPWDGDAIAKSEYYVLSNPGGLDLVWEKDSKGKVPLGAIQGGKTIDGEELYIGRVKMDSSFISGKVHPSHNTCYIPHDGKEKGFETYEVLCVKCVPVLVKEK